jgi:hypothetical protein
VDRDVGAVLERQAAVARHVVGVVVRLEHPRDPQLPPFGLLEVLLDRVGGVDDGRLAGRAVPDQVGGTAEAGIEELVEDHRRSQEV